MITTTHCTYNYSLNSAEMVERREKEVKKTSESLDQLTELVMAQSEENKKSQELHVQNSLEHMSKLKVLVEECQVIWK